MVSASAVGDKITVGGFRVGYPLNLTLDITRIVANSLVATVTHSDTTTVRLQAGDTVEIDGMSQASFNAIHVITGTPTSTTFTFVTAESDGTYNAPSAGARGKPIAYTQNMCPI